MRPATSGRARLTRELTAARAERDEARQALRAILNGEVDAVVVPGPGGDQLFSRSGPDQRYRALVEAMNEGAVLLTHGTITYCNGRLAKLLGTSLDQIIGSRFERFVAAEHRAALSSLLEHAMTSAKTMEITVLNDNGTPVPAQISASAVDLASAPAICLIVTDLSALLHSEHRFQRLAESLPQLVWTCLPDGSCDYLSPQWFEYTGMAGAEQSGSGWLHQVHPDDRERAERAWTKCVATGARFDIEYRIRRFDGAYRWFAARGATLRDSAGRVTKSIGHAIDVDDRIQMEQRFTERTHALERSNRELEQFAYSASHDLQEPLRMISSYTQLLLKRCDDQLDETAREFMGYVVEGAQRMHLLINGLLAFSRIGAELHAMPAVASSDVAAEAIDHLHAAIAAAGATVRVGPMPDVAADRAQLLQVFHHLVGNALKFRAADPPSISISAVSDGALVRIAVSDNGLGIDPAHHQRIFDLFQRLHPRGQYSGTGVGLAICRKIVEWHGGTIWVESKPGAGSTFFFTITAASVTRTQPRYDQAPQSMVKSHPQSVSLETDGQP